WSESVHGLMVLGMSYGILVWNPTTGQHVTLPEPMFDYKYYCLGYDPVDDKFKLLCISRDRHQVPLVLTLGPREESWRETQNSPSHFSIRRKGICINGHVYYRAKIHFQGEERRSKDKKRVLMRFDVRYENFNTISIPEDPTLGNLIFEYQGKLAWFCSDLSSSIRFWVFEGGKKQEWSPRDFLLPFPRFALHDPVWQVPMSLCGVAHETGEFVYVAASTTRKYTRKYAEFL
ncbi:hypothetical protein EUTSA_v10012378mg, partial [Eutrema salsugineum]